MEILILREAEKETERKREREICFLSVCASLMAQCAIMTEVKQTAAISGISTQTFHTPLFTLIDKCNLMALVTELESN